MQTERINSTTLKVLAVILRPGPRPSQRKIASLVGCSQNNVVQHIDRLSGLGLATYQPRTCGTTRATCRFIPASQLFSGKES